MSTYSRIFFRSALALVVPACQETVEPAPGPSPTVSGPDEACPLRPARPQEVVYMASNDGTFVLRADGSLWCWGDGPSYWCDGGYWPTAHRMPFECIRYLPEGENSMGAALSYQNSVTVWTQAAIGLPEDPFVGSISTFHISDIQRGADTLFVRDDVGAWWLRGTVVSDEVEKYPELTPLPWGNHVKQLVISNPHYGVSEDGRLLTWDVDEPFMPPAELEAPGPIRAFYTTSSDGNDCLLTESGEVWCRGSNNTAQLGVDPKLTEQRDEFGRVGGLPPLTTLQIGGQGECGIDVDHQLWCWGRDSGVYTDDHVHLRIEPIKIDAFAGVSAFALSRDNLCIATLENEIWCRGFSSGNGRCDLNQGWGPVDFSGAPCAE